MAEWMDMAKDSLEAAGQCLRIQCYRSAVSRSYYAIFSALTAALHSKGVASPARRETWPHRSLPDLVRAHLPQRLGRGRAANVRRLVGQAYKNRVNADYSTKATIDAQTARRCLADASAVIHLLEAMP